MEFIAMKESPGRDGKERESGRKELIENTRKGSYGHLQKALSAEFKIFLRRLAWKHCEVNDAKEKGKVWEMSLKIIADAYMRNPE